MLIVVRNPNGWFAGMLSADVPHRAGAVQSADLGMAIVGGPWRRAIVAYVRPCGNILPARPGFATSCNRTTPASERGRARRYVLCELRLARGVRRVLSNVSKLHVPDLVRLGYKRACFQELARKEVRLNATIPRWTAVGEAVKLARLVTRDRARLRGAPADAVTRLLWTVGTHDPDHWSHAFFRQALMLL